MGQIDENKVAVAGVLTDVLDELNMSTARHGLYHSAHEGHSVMREELEEVWEHVRANTAYTDAAYHEAKQVASTAMKFMLMVRARQVAETDRRRNNIRRDLIGINGE